MSAAITPGPWEVNHPPQLSRRVLMPNDCIEIRGANGAIAFLYAVNADMKGETDRANAKAIAAVPAMIEALLAGVAYDTLLLRYKGPLEVLTDGDNAEIDAAYDRWRDTTVAALKLAGVEL